MSSKALIQTSKWGRAFEIAEEGKEEDVNQLMSRQYSCWLDDDDQDIEIPSTSPFRRKSSEIIEISSSTNFLRFCESIGESRNAPPEHGNSHSFPTPNNFLPDAATSFGFNRQARPQLFCAYVEHLRNLINTMMQRAQGKKQISPFSNTKKVYITPSECQAVFKPTDKQVHDVFYNQSPIVPPTSAPFQPIPEVKKSIDHIVKRYKGGKKFTTVFTVLKNKVQKLPPPDGLNLSTLESRLGSNLNIKKRPTGSATGIEFPILNSSFQRVNEPTKPGTSSSPKRKSNVIKGGIILPEAKNIQNSTFSLPKKNIKFNYQRKQRSMSKQSPPKKEADFPRVFKRNKKSLGNFTPTSSQKSFKIQKRKINILETQSMKAPSKPGSTNRSGFTSSNRIPSYDKITDNEHFIREEDGDDKTQKQKIKAPSSTPKQKAQEGEKNQSENLKIAVNRKSPIQVTHGQSTLEIMEKSYISATAGIKSERSVSRTSVDFEMGLASGKVLFIKPDFYSRDEYHKSKSKQSTRHQSLMSSRIPQNAKAPKSTNNINFNSFGISKTPKNVNIRRNTQGPGTTLRAGRQTPQPPDTPQTKRDFPEKVSCYPFTMAAFQEFKITSQHAVSPNPQQTLAPKEETQPRSALLARKDNESFLQNLTRLANNGFSKAVRKMIPIKEETGILIKFQHNLKSLDSNDLQSLCIKNRASESSATTTSTLADKVSSYKSTLRDGKAFVLPLLK